MYNEQKYYTKNFKIIKKKLIFGSGTVDIIHLKYLE